MKPKTRKRPPPAHDATPGLALRSKSAQLADFLRQCIREGKVPNPPPGIRQWSRELGVSRRTLHLALQELQRENLLTVNRRGVEVRSPATRAGSATTRRTRQVLMLFDSAYRRQINNYLETLSLLQARLGVHGIELRWEICPPTRLREIARRELPHRPFLILASLPPVYQRLFAAAGHPSLALGEVAPGIPLPFINANQSLAVRHATFRLLQRGLTRVTLVHVDVAAAGMKSAVAAFRLAATEWSRQPVHARLLPTTLDRPSLTNLARRLGAVRHEREGYIVLAPVPLGLVVSALLHHGIAIPRQAEVISLFHSSEAVTLFPTPTFYPSPIIAIVKHLVAAALYYFEHGTPPPIATTLPVEVGDRE